MIVSLMKDVNFLYYFSNSCMLQYNEDIGGIVIW